MKLNHSIGMEMKRINPALVWYICPPAGIHTQRGIKLNFTLFRHKKYAAGGTNVPLLRCLTDHVSSCYVARRVGGFEPARFKQHNRTDIQLVIPCQGLESETTGQPQTGCVFSSQNTRLRCFKITNEITLLDATETNTRRYTCGEGGGHH